MNYLSYRLNRPVASSCYVLDTSDTSAGQFEVVIFLYRHFAIVGKDIITK